MLFPLIVLSVPAILAGLIAPSGTFGVFVEGALLPEMRHFHFHVESIVVASSTVAALAGIGVAAAIYYAGRPQSSAIRSKLGPLPRIAERLYYVNEIAEDGVVRGGLYGGAGRAAAAIDTYLVDGAVNGAARATRLVGEVFRRTITGQLQAYTSVMILGVVAAAGALLVLGGGLLDRVMP